MQELGRTYHHELFNEILPFWEHYSVDEEYGGFFTCILPNGKVFDTDKFVWLQARGVYTFAKFGLLEQNERWVDIARKGAEFLLKHGRDDDGKWYFALDRYGNPTVAPYNIFSDCFATLAFVNLYRATENQIYLDVAISTFEQILNRQQNPKWKYNKSMHGRSLQNFSLPMILCNLTIELKDVLQPEVVEKTKEQCIDLVMNKFWWKETGLIHENIGTDGSFSDSFEGRLINPGHVIEAMWFVMDLAMNDNDKVLLDKAESMVYHMLEYGWDEQYGGIYYFMDCKGYPPQQLEHDQKLWWVHLESLVALAKLIEYKNSKKAKMWFEKLHDYSWNRFRDIDNGGEWYGYLNRRGERILDLKGGKWKGCFHVPRACYEIGKALQNSN